MAPWFADSLTQYINLQVFKYSRFLFLNWNSKFEYSFFEVSGIFIRSSGLTYGESFFIINTCSLIREICECVTQTGAPRSRFTARDTIECSPPTHPRKPPTSGFFPFDLRACTNRNQPLTGPACVHMLLERFATIDSGAEEEQEQEQESGRISVRGSWFYSTHPSCRKN